MIPLKDTIRSRSFPVVTWLIILVCGLAFLFEVSLSGRQGDLLIEQFGLIPARLNPLNPLTWYPLVSHMFLHGGWFHLISNLWILFIFGDNVEDRMGSERFLLFYLAGGVVAGLIQSLVSPDKTIPAIGASGAIAAVLGAYFFFFPRARVFTLILLIIIPLFVEIPAVVFLGIWFVTQIFSGVLSLASAGMQWGGVAWFAHIGGFLFGLLLARLFASRRRQYRWYPDEYYPW